MTRRVESDRFPYLRFRLEVGRQTHDLDALIATGFDGFLAVPPDVLANGQPSDDYQSWSLADGRRVTTPLYLGTINVGDLGTVPALIIAPGDEPLVGRRVTDRFRLILDHGERVILGPTQNLHPILTISLLDRTTLRPHCYQLATSIALPWFMWTHSSFR